MLKPSPSSSPGSARGCLPRGSASRLLMLGVLALCPIGASRTQEDAGDKPVAVPHFSSFLSLPAGPTVNKRFDAARDYLKNQRWAEAMRVLQTLLDGPEDAFLPLTEQGAGDKETIRWTSVRTEADRLLATVPEKGVEFYETVCGPRARALLAEARRKNDPGLLGRIVQRHLHTRAGIEAAVWLGAYHLDRGRPALAARYFELALGSAAGRKPAPRTLFLAALASRASGDRKRAAQAWDRLIAAAPDGVRLGDRTLSLAELEHRLTSTAPTRSHKRPACGRTGDLALTAGWQRSTVHEDMTRTWLQSATQQLEAASQPVLPAFSPITAAGKVIYRSHRGVEAVDRRTGELAWESPSEWSLDGLVREANHRAHAGRWIDAYLPAHPHLLFDNSILGSLSTDGTRVFAVEDLAALPFPRSYAGFVGRRGQGLELALAPELTAAVYHNRLLAIDAATGKVSWEQGGRGGPGLVRDSFFLGPPLPLAGRLYALVEKDEELSLVCLAVADGNLLWSQKLATPRNPLVLDGGRRQHAAHLAYSNGVLICPTNAGGLIGFDLVTRRLAWAHAYRAEPPPPPMPPPGRRRWGRMAIPTEPPNLTPLWQNAAPIIAEGKVVFTAPDEASLQCVGLRDGRLLWQVERKNGDLFLAGVHQGKVLVAGTHAFRALRLSDGFTLWESEVGLPSGRGAAAAGVYYLPLQAPEKGEGPIVCAIDIEKGALWQPLTPPAEGVGNLVFCAGMVLSQTVSTLTAYPQRPAPGKP